MRVLDSIPDDMRRKGGGAIVQSSAHCKMAHGLKIGEESFVRPIPCCSAQGAVDYTKLGARCYSKSVLGRLGNALRKVTIEHYLASITSSKANIPVSKVGYPSVRNNPKGTHLHEKS